MESRLCRAALPWLLTGGLASCTHTAAEPSLEPMPSMREAIDRCVAEAETRDPQLELHALGQQVSRGSALVGVAIEIPEDPELEACLERMPAQGVRSMVDGKAAPDSLGVGGFAVDVGEGERPKPTPEQAADGLARHRERTRTLVESLVADGTLPADSPVVQSVLADPEAAR